MSTTEGSLAADRVDGQRICCIYCRHWQLIPRRAVSARCKHCSRQLRLDSLSINLHQARKTIETCGALTIEKEGNVFSERVLCGTLIVHGKIRSEVLCHGPVEVAPQGQLRGNITAPTLTVGEGAVLEGFFRIGLPTAIEMAASAAEVASHAAV